MGDGRKRSRAPRRERRGPWMALALAALVALVGAGVLAAKSLQDAPAATPAPAWSATSTDGEPLGSEAFAGEVYALDFFFLSCGICKDQLPANRALVQALAARDDFTFVSVTADPSDTPDLIDAHRREDGAPWPHVRDTTGLYASFDVRGNPNIVFVDREGNIAATITRLASGDELLAEAQRLLDA